MRRRRSTRTAVAAEEAAEGEGEDVDSSILDREPLCARSLSDTLSHIRRRGYLMAEDARPASHFKPAHIGAHRRVAGEAAADRAVGRGARAAVAARSGRGAQAQVCE